VTFYRYIQYWWIKQIPFQAIKCILALLVLVEQHIVPHQTREWLSMSRKIGYKTSYIRQVALQGFELTYILRRRHFKYWLDFLWFYFHSSKMNNETLKHT
jgi:hypothetical protein